MGGHEFNHLELLSLYLSLEFLNTKRKSESLMKRKGMSLVEAQKTIERSVEIDRRKNKKPLTLREKVTRTDRGSLEMFDNPIDRKRDKQQRMGLDYGR